MSNNEKNTDTFGKKSFKKSKIPKLFRKSYSEEKFQKLLKKVFTQSDKQLILNFFIKNEQELYVLDENELDKKSLKQLKDIAKIIKTGKSLMQKKKIIALALILIVFGALVFFLKNILATKALELGLEKAFRAPAKVVNLDLKIFTGEISIGNIEVVNRREPTKNLFELTGVRLDVELRYLFFASFVTNYIGVDKVELGTNTSIKNVKIPESEQVVESKKIEFNTDGLGFDQLKLSNTENFLTDKEIEIEERIDNLTALFEDTKQASSQLITTIKSQESNVKEAQQSIKSIKTLQDLEESKRVLEGIEAEFNGIKTQYNIISDNTSKLSSDFSQLSYSIGNFPKELVSSIKQDTEDIQDNLEGQQELIRERLQQMLEDSFVGKTQYQVESLVSELESYLEKAKEYKNKTKKQELPVSNRDRRQGKVIPFPSKVIPKVLIKEVHSRYEDSYGFVVLDAHNLSSDQDLIDRPAVGLFNQDYDGKQIDLKTVVDLREGSEETLNLTFMSDGAVFDVDLTGVQGLERYRGSSKMDLSFIYRPDNSYSSRLFTSFYDTEIVKVGDVSNDLVGLLVDIYEENDLEALLKIQKKPNADQVSININLNLDELLSGNINRVINQYIVGLREGYTEKLNQYQDEFNGQILTLQRDLASNVDSLKAEYERLANEVEVSLRDQYNSLSNELNYELERKKKEAEDLVNQEIEKAKSEAEKRAEEELEKAKEEAKDRLKNLF